MKRNSRAKTKNIIHETCQFFTSSKYQMYVESEIQKKQWIYKIIAGEKEQDQILFKSENFVVLPDLETKNEIGIINWIIIFNDFNLKSLRDLTHKNLKMLTDVKKCIQDMLPDEFQEAMMYFHYPPSVWQLHLHVSAPCNILRTTNSMQKVYFLQDVMSGLYLQSDFYKLTTLTYILPINHELSILYNSDQIEEQQQLVTSP
jgi:hypothetical protein